MVGRDHEKDALPFRSDIFKYASTVSIALVTIFSTFFLIGFKQIPSPRWIFFSGILALILTAVAGVYALSNMAYHVRNGRYGVPGEQKVALWVIYILFPLGLLVTVTFLLINVGNFDPQRKEDRSEQVSMYLRGYIDKVLLDKIKLEAQKVVDLKAKEIQAEITHNIDEAFGKQKTEMKRYVEEALKRHDNSRK